MASQRPHPITERTLDAPLLTFDTAALLAQIKGEDTWQQGPRNAMTLHKGPGLQVVLIAVHANTTIPPIARLVRSVFRSLRGGLPSALRRTRCPSAQGNC